MIPDRALGGTNPLVWCAGGHEVLEMKLSELLPNAFGPGNLTGSGQT